MMSLWDALRMNMMISYQELVRTFLNTAGITHVEKQKINNKDYVCNLRSARSTVIAAIDALVTNT